MTYALLKTVAMNTFHYKKFMTQWPTTHL